MIYCEDCSSYDCGCPERKEIESLRQQLAAATDQIAAAVAACKIKDDALAHILRCIPIGGFAQIHWDSTTRVQIDEALVVMPSISEWKTNDELRQQLAERDSEHKVLL